MGFINLGRLNIRKRNSCASALVSLSDIQPPSVYKSHILNGPINKLYLSCDVAVIQWITSCHKNRMTTPVIITLWRVYVMSLTASVSTMRVLNAIMHILEAIKSHFKGSYDKHNLTLVVIPYEIYETHRRLVS